MCLRMSLPHNVQLVWPQGPSQSKSEIAKQAFASGTKMDRCLSGFVFQAAAALPLVCLFSWAIFTQEMNNTDR